MTKQDILQQVIDSNWQPEFEFTDNLDAVVDSILKPHEDYFLGLHSKVQEIIEREISFAKDVDAYKITFADVCNWQKELFEHKLQLVNENLQDVNHSKSSKMDGLKYYKTLPNLHINLGLRDTIVRVGNWIPPHPMFLEDLKEMCFPINSNSFCDDLCDSFSFTDSLAIKEKLTEWYKVFESIHFYNDLNGRVGGIVINILSYLLTGKYLINKTNQH